MKFLKDYSWMHIVYQLAGDYLNMEKVLDEPAGDAFAVLQYLDAKGKADEAQFKFEENLNKARRRH